MGSIPLTHSLRDLKSLANDSNLDQVSAPLFLQLCRLRIFAVAISHSLNSAVLSHYHSVRMFCQCSVLILLAVFTHTSTAACNSSLGILTNFTGEPDHPGTQLADKMMHQTQLLKLQLAILWVTVLQEIGSRDAQLCQGRSLSLPWPPFRNTLFTKRLIPSNDSISRVLHQNSCSKCYRSSEP